MDFPPTINVLISSLPSTKTLSKMFGAFHFLLCTLWKMSDSTLFFYSLLENIVLWIFCHVWQESCMDLVSLHRQFQCYLNQEMECACLLIYAKCERVCLCSVCADGDVRGCIYDCHDCSWGCGLSNCLSW